MVDYYYLVNATNADFDFVYELKKIAYKEYVEKTWGWDDSFQLKFHKENFKQGNTKIIKADEVQIGSVDVKEGEKNFFVSGLYLLPAYQSMGIGTKITNDLVTQAGLKAKRLELEVLKVNTRALKFYDRLGFKLQQKDTDKHKYFMYKEVDPVRRNNGTTVEIVEFGDLFTKEFADLNKAWLQKFFEVEPIDEEIFSNPRGYIIDNGGHIFFAKLNGQVAGTFALIKAEGHIFELSKMAVDERFQGRKIGNRMVEFAIEKAKELQADKLVLYSNRILKPALHLYSKFGFKEVPLGSVEYKRADIKMEIELKKEQ